MEEIILQIIYVAAIACFMFLTIKRMETIEIELEKQRKKTEYFMEIIAAAFFVNRKEKENGHQQCNVDGKTD